MSDLHKKNLEALRNSSDGAPGSSSYRDRAKERRDRFGFDKDVGKNTLKVKRCSTVILFKTKWHHFIHL